MIPAVAQHRATLRSLQIIGMRDSGLSGFDLTAFTCLEDLRLSTGSTGRDIDDQAQLLAPRLRKFTWIFPGFPSSHHDIGWNVFGQREEDWIRSLAQTAAGYGSPLREIFIDDQPTFEDDDQDGISDTYPWDRMDRVADEIRGSGITLSYNPPQISRDAYYRSSYFFNNPDQTQPAG